MSLFVFTGTHLENNQSDNTLIVVGLLLLKDLLFMSNYPEEQQTAMAKRIDKLIEDINHPGVP